MRVKTFNYVSIEKVHTYLYILRAIQPKMVETIKHFKKINQLARGKVDEKVKHDKKEIGKPTKQQKL